MSIKLSYPRSPDNGQMSDKSLELCPQYPHPYTGDTGTRQRNLALIGRTLTINRSAQHWHHGQQCMVILQRVCLQMSGTENICAFFHYLCQLQLAFWLFLQNLCPKKCPGTLLCCALSVVTSLWLSLPGGEQEFVSFSGARKGRNQSAGDSAQHKYRLGHKRCNL